ncbi:AraC family transcriptional regulator [Tenacibaculum jejuense]|uniref:AraC-type transcriptional regulator n=1 Tax=Tenacibaculum jejuense TaxID=584609 RepID=A0A238UCA0_9FLAO|nr:helix-turn-helix domain-containing protein [Tenacibaculum jejuense]SNR16685.1 AraC-type transcriptional regulator [Tenacibaculum jejuense]
MKPIKQVTFKKKNKDHLYFDLVDLSSIIHLKPSDHNQFEHHKVSFYVMVFISKGEGIHNINYQDYSYQKGTIFTLRKNNIHKFYKSEASGKILVFTEDFIIKYSDKFETLKLFQLFNEMLSAPKIQLNSSEFEEIRKIVLQINIEFSNSNDSYSTPIIRSLVQVLILKLLQIKSKSNTNFDNKNYHLKFTKLQELIEKECFESKKVSFYAEKLGVSSKTLNNITQSIVGKSTKAFIDEILILQIKRLIINSQLSLTEIAYHVGFDSPTNFFKYFRKRTQLSPKEFKELNQ